jgi:GTP-binding protein
MEGPPLHRFVDRVEIVVQAGRGGNGCRSSYKDLWTRHPIPDGGDGGRGGHVVLRANPQLTTLADLQDRQHFHATNGGHGSSKCKQGRLGSDCIVDLPLGTVVRDAETGERICELLVPGKEVIVARGGEGGMGNAHQSALFHARPKGAKRHRSAWFDPDRLNGKPGEKKRLLLELKLVADVGIVGMPNAGKSTLLSKISHARPKIAHYPFTTTAPVLGVVQLKDDLQCVAVDVPGLIEGAHRGKGLGLEFLRHIERTRILVHLIDMAGTDGRDPVEDHRVLLEELKAYGPHLLKKPRIVVANKMDLPQARRTIDRFRRQVGIDPIEVSALAGEGITELLEAIAARLRNLEKSDDLS